MPIFLTANGTGSVSDVRFPLSGNGSTVPLQIGPWLTDKVVYASPSGSDSNTGDSWATAKKYGYSAQEVLVDAGGGVLNYADGTHWGGPVANQGIMLRGDGLAVDGFLPHVPTAIIGHGGPEFRAFGFGPAARLWGGATPGLGTGRLLPSVWLVNTQTPFVLKNHTPNLTIANCPYRSGWDYRRFANGTMATAAITQWDRADGEAEVTVQLPTGLAITQAQRTGGNVVTLTFPSDIPVRLPLLVPGQQWIKVNSTDPDFPSGDFIVTEYTTSTLKYTQAGSNVVATNIGTWQSPMVCPWDIIEVFSDDPEVPSTAYQVRSVTDATHFTVRDYYGYGPRSATVTVSNPGTWVAQQRFGYGSGSTTFLNCHAAITQQNTDTFEVGPVHDYGSSADGRQIVEKCVGTGGWGLAGTSEHVMDPDRGAYYTGNGGSFGWHSGVLRQIRSSNGSVRLYPSRVALSTYDLQEIQPDIAIGLVAPPVIEVINGNPSYWMFADRCYNTDQEDTTVPDILLDVANPMRVHIQNCPNVQVGTGGAKISGMWGVGGEWTEVTESPLSKNLYGTWVDGRWSGKFAGTWRRGGVQSSRFQNLLPDDPGTWAGGDFVVTAGQPDPFGGTGAVKIEGNGFFLISQTLSLDNAVGDRWIVASMVRRDGGFDTVSSQQQTMYCAQAGNNGNFSTIAEVQFRGDGEWQFIAKSGVIETVDTPENYTFTYLKIDDSLTVYRPALYRIQADSGVSENEILEYLQTLGSQAGYLPAGMDGTDLNRKLVAHGGIGTGLAYVEGVGAGQLTIVGSFSPKKYEPVFKADGTIKGWVELVNATVNP